MCSFHAVLAQSENAGGQGVGTVYLAKDDGTGKAGEPVSEFKSTDVPIYCVVLLEKNVRSVVKMVFVAMDVAGVKAETKVVTSAYTTTEGQNIVNFTGRPHRNWIPGKYRVDVFIDDKLATDVEFHIRPSSRPTPPKAGRSTASKKPKAPIRPANP